MIKGLTFVYSARYRSVNAQAILQGLVWALGVNLSICFVLGVWAILSPAGLSSLDALMGSSAWLGVFAGGLTAGKNARNSGWLHGGAVGFCYGLILIFFNLFGEATALRGLDLSGRLGLNTICAMAGGIVGVNLPRSLKTYRNLAWSKRYFGKRYFRQVRQ